VILNLIFASLALLSLALTLWQWLVARRFPLHQRVAAKVGRAVPSAPQAVGNVQDVRVWASSNGALRTARPITEPLAPLPSLSLLKPLKGCDPATEDCLRSWLTQDYPGLLQILFGVADGDDPVCAIVRRLLQEFPASDAQLVVCGPPPSANAKICQLIELERRAKHDLLILSDADVRVPPDCLANVVVPLQQPEVGLVNCFYRLANPTTLAMQWEAIAINADFWSQVLQSASLKPIDFALGAVMATRRQQLADIGGFKALADCLADDYLLGNRIAQRGYRIALSPVVVECWSVPMSWSAVWKHQLRWARTIRVCQPVPYFFSLLSNATLWPLLWLLAKPVAPVLACALGCALIRVLTALNLEYQLTRRRPGYARGGLVPVKDLLQAAIWLLAFLGSRIEWRGERLRLRRDGTLVRG
jgi:ceramide glucosyltransferase